jgi:ribosomal protein S27AE
LKQRPICPKCGGVEMYLHYGIDEPDFWQCDSLSCSRKIYY